MSGFGSKGKGNQSGAPGIEGQGKGYELGIGEREKKGSFKTMLKGMLLEGMRG